VTTVPPPGGLSMVSVPSSAVVDARRDRRGDLRALEPPVRAGLERMRLRAPRTDDRNGVVRLVALDLHERRARDLSHRVSDGGEHLGRCGTAGDEAGDASQRGLLEAGQIGESQPS
jgi:hypothetical protein